LNRITTTACLGAVLAAFAVAAQPVASAVSFSSFDLDGNQVNVAGVPAWTIMSGSNIAAGASSLTVSFKDGSRITLSPFSRLRVDQAGTSVNLLAGSMVFSRPASSPLQILEGGQSVIGSSGSRSSRTSHPELGPPPAPIGSRPPAPVSSR
jgi:hypothetical protein